MCIPHQAVQFWSGIPGARYSLVHVSTKDVLSPTLAELFQLAGLHRRVLPHVCGRDARIDCSPHLGLPWGLGPLRGSSEPWTGPCKRVGCPCTRRVPPTGVYG